jgi:chromosome partitioning protein
VRLGEIAPVPTPIAAAPAAVEPAAPEHEKPTTRPALGPAHVIAVFNHKGGTGKTTTSVSLAAGLALRGKRVLVVDTDAQGNVGVSFNVKAERSLYHVVVMGLSAADASIRVRENVDLVISNESLAAAELYLAGRQNRDRVLSRRLAAARDSYDVIVLDCSPSLSLMNQNALVFADSLLVPVACDYLSLVGVRQVIRTVKNVNQLLHHPVRIWGVLPTFYDARARICREALATMRDHFGERCLEPIRAAMKIKEAPSLGQTIFEYAAGSHPAEDYMRAVDRLIGAPRSETSDPVSTHLDVISA